MKRFLKITAGVILTICGLFGFLPIIGFWMLPIGLGILGTEIPAVRAFNIRLKRWVVKRFRRSK